MCVYAGAYDLVSIGILDVRLGKVMLIMMMGTAGVDPGTRFRLRKRVLLLAAAGLLFFGMTASSAQATSLTFGLDIEFSGGTEPSSTTTPWVTGTIDDSFGGSNTVRFTMSAGNLTGGTGGEALAFFYLNFDPLLDAANLTFTVVDNSDSVPNEVLMGNNLFMADGDGFFDIAFNFPQPPGSGALRFTEGETVIYDLTYTSAIDVSSFLFFSQMGGGTGVFLAAAHIQRTGGGQESGWIGAIPEPGSAALLALGITALGLKRRRAGR